MSKPAVEPRQANKLDRLLVDREYYYRKIGEAICQLDRWRTTGSTHANEVAGVQRLVHGWVLEVRKLNRRIE